MKKFMKFCLIAALIMIGAGVGLALVTQAINGGPVTWRDLSDGMRQGSHSHITSWGADIMDELDDIHYEISDADILFDDGHPVWNGDVARQSMGTDAEIDKIEIEAAGCILNVEISPDDHYYVEMENVKRAQGYTENGTLHIKTLSNANHWNDIEKRHITLYVPEGAVLEEVDVELGAGEIALQPLSADKVSLEVGAGQVTGSELRVSDKLSIEIGAGTVELNDIQAAKLDAEVSMGDLTVQGDIAKKGDLSCAMGNITLNLEGAWESYNYDIQSAMGGVTIGNDEYSGLASEKRISNGADRDITVECSMGNIEVFFED